LRVGPRSKISGQATIRVRGTGVGPAGASGGQVCGLGRSLGYRETFTKRPVPFLLGTTGSFGGLTQIRRAPRKKWGLTVRNRRQFLDAKRFVAVQLTRRGGKGPLAGPPTVWPKIFKNLQFEAGNGRLALSKNCPRAELHGLKLANHVPWDPHGPSKPARPPKRPHSKTTWNWKRSAIRGKWTQWDAPSENRLRSVPTGGSVFPQRS